MSTERSTQAIPVIDLQFGGTAQWLGYTTAREAGLVYCVAESWSTDGDSSDLARALDGNVVWDDQRPAQHDHDVVVKTPTGVAIICHSHRDVRVSVYSGTPAAAAVTLARLREILPAAQRTSKLLDVTFWYSTAHGPRRYDRQLQAPTWKEIESNYPGTTREKIEQLRTVELTEGAGKLILWQGEPGTGKTFALRALGEEWASWCRIHYVLDPEKFFTEGDYLLSVILEEDGAARLDSTGSDVRPSWRLIVLEDAGEMLAKDAKLQVGQGLARLLNLCDGLLGQGLRVLVLITTNEQVGTLHAAVSRPGRCLSQIVFEKFDVAAANQWLREHEAETSVMNATPLAGLYALAHGGKLPDRKVAGFK